MSKGLFRSLGGSDANETNIKLDLVLPTTCSAGRRRRRSSHAGAATTAPGLMTGSLTGLELFHKKFDLPLAQVVHTKAPYRYREGEPGVSEADFVAACVADLEALIEREGADTIAAFVAEPVLGTGRDRSAAGGLLGGDPAHPEQKRHTVYRR